MTDVAELIATDWLDDAEYGEAASRLLLMVGIAGLAAAAAVRVAMANAMPAPCVTAAIPPEWCATYVDEAHHWIRLTMWPGAVAFGLGLILQWRAIHD